MTSITVNEVDSIEIEYDGDYLADVEFKTTDDTRETIVSMFNSGIVIEAGTDEYSIETIFNRI